MGQRVTAMDVRMAAALAGGVPNVAAFCREQGITRQTFYKWRRRFAEGGVGGLEERSRRPHGSPLATAAEVEDAVVRLRKELADDGADHGPDSIRWEMVRVAGGDLAGVPSRATVARILSRRGLVVPEPKKRPRSSWHRFTYPRPNECWQSDWTGWHLADGAKIAIAGSLDDHSRYVPALRAAVGDGTAELVWATMESGIAEVGLLAMSLTDNGLVYSGARRGVTVAFETNLRALGVACVTSSPYHPQTCGKIERFWQTLKRWLRSRPAPQSIEAANALLEAFRDYYNHRRPHRALGGATPAAVFHAGVKARPASFPVPAPTRVATSQVSDTGVVRVADYEVSVGRRWRGHDVTTIHDGEQVAVFSGTRLVRALTLDPTRRYQPGPARYDLRGQREPKPHSAQ